MDRGTIHAYDQKEFTMRMASRLWQAIVQLLFRQYDCSKKGARSRARRRSEHLQRAVMEVIQPRILFSSVNPLVTEPVSMGGAPLVTLSGTGITASSTSYQLSSHPNYLLGEAITGHLATNGDAVTAGPVAPPSSVSDAILVKHRISATKVPITSNGSSSNTTSTNSAASLNSPAYGHGNFAQDETLDGFYYYYRYIYMVGWAMDAGGGDEMGYASNTSAPTIYIDGCGGTGSIDLGLWASFPDGTATASNVMYAIYDSSGSLVTQGNASEYDDTDGTEVVEVGAPASLSAGQTYSLIFGYDADNDGTLEQSEALSSLNIEAVDVYTPTINGSSTGPVDVEADASGNATIYFSTPFAPSDASGHVSWALSGGTASPNSGGLGGTQSATLTPSGGSGTYTFTEYFDSTAVETMTVDVLAYDSSNPPVYTLTATAQGPDDTSDSATSSNVTETLDGELDVESTSTITLSCSFSPNFYGPIFAYAIDENTDSEINLGQINGPVTFMAPSEGDVYNVYAGIDYNLNGNLDTDEITSSIQIVSLPSSMPSSPLTGGDNYGGDPVNFFTGNLQLDQTDLTGSLGWGVTRSWTNDTSTGFDTMVGTQDNGDGWDIDQLPTLVAPSSRNYG